MSDLVAFLNARLDEDEAAARSADPGPWEVGPKLGAHDSMVYVREQGALIDTVGITYRDPVFTSQVPNKTRFRENAAHIARHDPARVLREVESKRRIIASVASLYAGGYIPPHVHLKALAAVYSDHPDYDPLWGLASAEAGELLP